jgi:7-cyano-7-deazaguanine synthase
MLIEYACVLLSGGLDSVAALYWASTRYRHVRAIGFDYGQPNRDAEVYSAGTAAEALGVPFERLPLADAFPRRGLLERVPEHNVDQKGAHPAVVPGRNGAFLWLAAAHAVTWWRVGNIALVIGANKEDAAGFSDCDPRFFLKLGQAIRDGFMRQVDIVAPWVDRTKAQIIQQAEPEARHAIARSWSCYARTGPCGVCTACVLRARAFAETGLVDECAPPKMTGGDPQREARA